jgi:GTP-binding protein EngB required for normal cell division
MTPDTSMPGPADWAVQMSGGAETIIPDVRSPSPAVSANIPSLIAEAAELTVGWVGPERRRLLALGDRLQEGRLQLAVVGQFKRGKSTLLNALLGARVLPFAVTPLTAIATFLRNGSALKLISEDVQGRREEKICDSTDELRDLLQARVTEDGNPHNRLGLSKVEVEYPLPLLAAGVVLIDTPGVGSTYRHNTETARETLPQCDAALFVVSPDPPITATEVDYLREIRAVAVTILVVLNKIDLVDVDDRTRSEAFLRAAVHEAIGDRDVAFFSVSARLALESKASGDAVAMERSGITGLERHLEEFARTKRQPTLQRAIAQKAGAEIRELAYVAEMRLAASRLPAEELTRRLEEFRVAERTFDAERNLRLDVLSGDRQRLLTELNNRAAQMRERVQRSLHWDIDRQIASSSDVRVIRLDIADRLPKLFQTEFETLEAHERQHLEELLGHHQAQADDLIAKVRHAAAKLLEIPFMAPQAGDAFEAKKIPYWIDAPREALGNAPRSLLTALLPADMKRRRVRAQLVADADEMVARNVENLRWSIRQNLEDAIRRFQLELDERLQASQSATRQAIEEALKRRGQVEVESRDEISALASVHERLVDIASALQEGEQYG